MMDDNLPSSGRSQDIAPIQAKAFDTINKRCFINAPWYDLKEKYLDLFLEHRIQPEIGLEGLCLYNEDHKAFKRVATSLQKAGLACTLHAPFFDLAPGGLDPFILEKTREKLRKAFALLPIFQPRSIVCHLQFEENKHGYVYQQWFANACATWTELVLLAKRYNVPVMFENTYEKDPSVHTAMLTHLHTPFAGFCLDTGHLLAFAGSAWQEWLPAMLPWIGQLHVHDNEGRRDEHLAPGRGKFDFPGLFTFLRQNNVHPILTFEPHSEEDLWQTFAYLEATDLLHNI
jgi:sugar phosphate isomerase/epimerase